MQSAQKEHKANMDMMNKQLSQLENSMSEMKGNSGRLPSTVHIPEKMNVSKITLRSGTSYKEPEMKRLVGEPSTKGGSSEFSTQGRGSDRFGDDILRKELRGRNPQVTEQAQIGKKSCEAEGEKDQLPGMNNHDKTGPVTEPPTGAERGSSEEVTEILREVAKGEKPFLYRFVKKRKKEEPVDYLSIF